jgi:hypothetical protein
VVHVSDDNVRAIREDTDAANLAKEVMDLAGGVSLRINDADAVTGFGRDEDTWAAALDKLLIFETNGGKLDGWTYRRREGERPVTTDVRRDTSETTPHSCVPYEERTILVAGDDLVSTRRPNTCEPVVLVPFQYVQGDASLRIDDMRRWIVTDKDTQTAVWAG